jgi:hypothetical protein
LVLDLPFLNSISRELYPPEEIASHHGATMNYTSDKFNLNKITTQRRVKKLEEGSN